MRKGLLLALVAGIALVATQAPASDTKHLTGHLSSQAVTGPDCTSPVGLCTAGRLIGGIHGEFEFTGTSLTPSSTPGVFFYTGTIVVHTAKGDLTCTDAGAYSFAPTGEVVDLCTITGGTGELAGATGSIQISGVFTFDGGGDSDYAARLVLP